MKIASYGIENARLPRQKRQIGDNYDPGDRSMNTAKKLLGILVLVLAQWSAFDRTSSSAVADDTQHSNSKLEGRYQGPWVTTKNKKLDGIANCEVEQLAKDKWKGRFWGVWQHVPFDYTVEFGP